MEQVNGGQEFNNSIAQELQSLVVRDLAVRFEGLAESGHDVDERVDTTLSGVHVVDFTIPVFRLTDSTVGQGVASVIGVRSKVLLV